MGLPLKPEIFPLVKFVKYVARNAIISLIIALIYGYLRETSKSAENLSIVVFIGVGLSAISYLKFWSGTYFPPTSDKAGARDLFPDSRFKETKPQEEDFMWDLKLYGRIFVPHNTNSIVCT